MANQTHIHDMNPVPGGAAVDGIRMPVRSCHGNQENLKRQYYSGGRCNQTIKSIPNPMRHCSGIRKRGGRMHSNDMIPERTFIAIYDPIFIQEPDWIIEQLAGIPDDEYPCNKKIRNLLNIRTREAGQVVRDLRELNRKNITKVKNIPGEYRKFLSK
jgi:hypothetical protein